jgi:hypothetical protein
MVVPWILKLLALAILFYGGIYFNVKYALGSQIPPIINLFIFAFLIVLIATQVIIYHIKFGKFKYSFYTNRVEFEGKKVETFMFSDFQAAELKQNMFDRMFDTGSLKLTKSFSIGPVSGITQVKSYLEQLVRYYVSMQDRYKAQQQQAAMQREMQQAAQPAQQYVAPQQQASTSQSPVQSAQQGFVSAAGVPR